MDQSDQAVPLIDRPGDGASQWIQHDAEQPDRHPPGSAWSVVMPATELVLTEEMGHITHSIQTTIELL